MKQPNKDKKKKKIVVPSKNDPRYKAYQDSLALYNNHKKVTKELIDAGYRKREGSRELNKDDAIKSFNHIKRRNEQNNNYRVESNTLKSTRDFIPGERDKNGRFVAQNEEISRQLYSDNIDPIGIQSYMGSGTPVGFFSGIFDSPEEKAEKVSKYRDKTGDWKAGDIRTVANYSNVKPNEEVIVENSTKMNKTITPKPYIQPRNIGKPLELKSKGLNVSNESPKSALAKIPQKAVRNWDIEQSVNQNFGGNTKKFKITTRKELEALERKQAVDEQTKTGNKNTLKITPNYYALGGKLNDMKKKKIIPKKAVGGLLATTGISLLSSVLGNAKIKRQQEEAEQRANAINAQAELSQDTLALEDYEQEGYGAIDYYAAYGGKLAKPSSMTKGGVLQPLSSDAEIAKGNKHGESKIDGTSGIKLYEQGGQPFAEVEDEEVIKDGNKVFSDQLKTSNGITYAEAAEKLAKEKGKYEKDLASSDVISKNTAQRQVEILDAKEEALFQEQEASKPQQNTEVLAEGGFAKVVEDFAPFVDNVTNTILTAGTPKIPDARIQRAVKLPTTVNANPQLNAVTRAVDASTTGIKNNTSNSAVARNEMTSARLRGANAKANILANKENQENQLKAASATANANIQSRNLQALDSRDMQQVGRSVDIQSRISKNASNLADDFIDKRNFDAAEDYNKERNDITRQMYQGDTTRRAMLNNPSEIQRLKSNPAELNEVLKMFRGTPEEERLRKLLGLNPSVNNNSYMKASSFAKID